MIPSALGVFVTTPTKVVLVDEPVEDWAYRHNQAQASASNTSSTIPVASTALLAGREGETR